MSRQTILERVFHKYFFPLSCVFLILVIASQAFGVEPSGPAVEAQGAVSNTLAPESYGGWVLLPALVAIVCAILTRQVIPSLLFGVLVGAFMLLRLDASAPTGAGGMFIGTVVSAIEKYIIGALVDSDRMKIVVFTLTIGGMVGVVGATGGTRALVALVARRASNRKRGQATAWLAGLVVFFDDYANTMIVGPTMQPICDRLKISRAKLAYIVDSTAAPVASIALVGTWVGTELGYIGDGLKDVAANGTPSFLAGVDAWNAFLNSIPHRYYAILAIVMVILVAFTGRDFGAMHRHEQSSAESETVTETEAAGNARWLWLLAGLPILILVAVTGIVLLYPGWQVISQARLAGQEWTFKMLFEGADSYNAILYGALASVTAAIALGIFSRQATFKTTMDAMMEGMGRMFPAIVVLVLAWALSSAAQDLHVGEVVSTWLNQKGFSIYWLPLAVFVSAAGVSFATGTSWGTMGILCPMVVRIAAELGGAAPADEALNLFYASVGSVLAGAIFGDHCSPISDTTVLSSIASGCSLEDHVWTQIPYALVVAVVSMLTGNILCSWAGLSPWLGLAIGIIVIWIILRLIGSHPRPELAAT